jgi:hypothetical protein
MRELLLANGNEAELLLLLILGLLCRHSVRALLQERHFGVFVSSLGLGETRGCARCKGRRAGEKEDGEALYIVEVVRLVVLDFGTIEEIDMAAFNRT